MKIINYICLTFVILGALNWGLIGFYNLDLFGEVFFSHFPKLSKLVLCLIGFCGIYCLSLYGNLDFGNFHDKIKDKRH